MEDYIQKIYPNARCHIFGSSATLLGFKNSDIDLYVDLSSDLRLDDFNGRCCVKILQRYSKPSTL